MTMPKRAAVWTGVLLWAVACGSPGDEGGSAVGVDAGGDMGAADAGGDMGRDGGLADAATDAGDAGSDAGDAAGAEDAGAGCDFGTASSAATATMESLFGERVPFAEDVALPAGTYELASVDGCFKSASNQGWTIHARDNGSTSWHLAGADPGPMDPFVLLPGTVGIFPADGAFEIFDDCVAANLALPPLVYTHAGGRLGIWLSDTNYPDNVVGEDGRNPTWRLTGLDCTE